MLTIKTIFHLYMRFCMNKFQISKAIALSLFFCFSLGAQGKKAISTGPITYKQIGDDYLASFGIVQTATPKESLDSQQSKKVNLEIPVLSAHEKREMIFAILADNEQSRNEDSKFAYALRIVLHDLDTYFGTGEVANETLMNKIDNTATAFGPPVLGYALAHPIKDMSVLRARQAFIKELLENETLCTALENHLQQIHNAEQGFLSYWCDTDLVSQKVIKDLYFNKALVKNFNNSSVALETLVRVDNAGTALKCTSDFWISTVIRYMMHKKGYALLEPESMLTSIIGTGKTFANMVNPMSYWQAYKEVDSLAFKMQLRMNNPSITEADIKNVMKGARLGILAMPALLTGYLALKAYHIKGYMAQAKQTRDAINYLQTRMIDVATIVNHAKQLQQLIGKTPFANGLTFFNNLQDLLQGSSRSQDFAYLVDLLQTNTFKDHASFFSLSGRVLAAHQLMEKNKANFAPALEAIGELDACLSIAKLIKSMQHEKVGYSFVEFVKTDKPTFIAQNFWNPFIDPKKVVVNSLELGQGADASKVVLTGSNTGGKSTALKGVLITLVLARSFGIAPAQLCVISPFDYIGSFFPLKDDTAAGDSRFKAEVLRAKLVCETLDSLAADEFGFVIIDELLTGTGAENGEPAAYKVAQKLANLENNIYILATHYPLLTKLEQDNPGLIKNYKIDIFKDANGNLIRTFKLEPGVSTQNVANDILNEEIKDMDFGDRIN